jgi:hypothetical protein
MNRRVREKDADYRRADASRLVLSAPMPAACASTVMVEALV